jgi:hypothetical protein
MRGGHSGRALVASGAMILGLAMAAGSSAQNMFYREAEKNGRIYVFALMAEFQNFEKTGEMGKSMTRLGYGPGGETVVFDGPDAINFYNFKHGRPGEVFPQPVEAPKPADTFSVKVGGTIFTDFTFTDAPKATDADGNGIRKSEFEARRAYINVTGSVSDLIGFRITPDVASRQATTASGLPSGATVAGNLDGSLTTRLKYGYGQLNLDRFVTKGSWARIGQQQTPYVDYMEGIYRYRFQGSIFVDREGFLSSSDVGLSARYAFPHDYGDVHAGVYNGDTYSKAEANDQKAFQVRGSLRPLPKTTVLSGLRLAAFYDLDHPVKSADRKRFVGAVTFEHTYVNAGCEFLDAKDNSSATKPVVASDGWSAWVTPRSKVGLEGLFRYDSLKPNKDVDARKKRALVGLAYWFKVQKSPLAAALLADYEQVEYDTALAKPKEKRFELKALFNF